MNEKEKNKKRLKIWLEQKRELNQARNFNRTSHYSKNMKK